MTGGPEGRNQHDREPQDLNPRDRDPQNRDQRVWNLHDQNCGAAGQGAVSYRLVLFVADAEHNSELARINLRKICDQYLKGRYLYEIETVNVLEEYQRALDEQVLVTPALVVEIRRAAARCNGGPGETGHHRGRQAGSAERPLRRSKAEQPGRHTRTEEKTTIFGNLSRTGRVLEALGISNGAPEPEGERLNR